MLLTPAELTRDPRARRAAEAAVAAGWTVDGLCVRAGGSPVPLAGLDVVRVGGERLDVRLRSLRLGGGRRDAAPLRELRGLYRLVRLARNTVRLAAAARRLPQPDVVHANDFDTLPAAWLLSRSRRARLVYDAHELYALQELDPPRLYRRLALALERALARRAAAVVTVGDAIATELETLLRLSAHPLVVLNCPAYVEADGVAAAPPPLAAVYQGALGHGRFLDDLLALGEEVGEEVVVHLRATGVDTDLVREAVASRGLAGRVVVHEPVDPGGLVQSLTGFHVGLVVTRPLTRNDELALPNKLFEYLMAGLAVAVPRLPPLTAVVDTHDVGITYEPGSTRDLGRALTALARSRGDLERMQRRAREAAREQYNAEAQRAALAAAWGAA